MKSVMLYFGSFNPVHKGHMAVAEWVLDREMCDEVWFVVSPRNPLKDSGVLIGEEHRLAMVNLAVEDSPYKDRLRACDIEFTMPRPSYTIDTLELLTQLYPEIRFSILMGSDILGQIERWKEWNRILDNYKIYVYPRRGYPTGQADPRFVILGCAPYEDFSSTEARENLVGNGDDRMLPEKIKEYIKSHRLWTTMEK